VRAGCARSEARRPSCPGSRRGRIRPGGFCVGVVEKVAHPRWVARRAGDAVLGLASSGLHSTATRWRARSSATGPRASCSTAARATRNLREGLPRAAGSDRRASLRARHRGRAAGEPPGVLLPSTAPCCAPGAGPAAHLRAAPEDGEYRRCGDALRTFTAGWHVRRGAPRGRAAAARPAAGARQPAWEIGVIEAAPGWPSPSGLPLMAHPCDWASSLPDRDPISKRSWTRAQSKASRPRWRRSSATSRRAGAATRPRGRGAGCLPTGACPARGT